MRHFAADFRYALRTFRKSPLFAAVAVASMAFGIATNAAVFTLVDQVVLRSLPVARPGELVQLSSPDSESFGGNLGDGTELSYAMYRDIKEHTTSLHDMFCRMEQGVTVTYGGRSELVESELVTGSYFPALGIQPALGRLFTAAEDGAPGGHPLVVLSFSFWQSRFGGARDVVGRTLSVNGHPYEIIGVVSPAYAGFDLGSPPQVYLPMTMQPRIGPQWLELNTRRFRWVQVFGRLNDGVTREQAQAALQPLYRSILERETAESAFAGASADTKRRFLEGAIRVTDASQGRSSFRDRIAEPLLILMAVAAGVLLIVCANVANLLLARGASRHRELALRLAVGASRRQVIRLLLVESLALAAAGAGLGLVMATWGAQFLLDFYVSADSPIALRAEPDARVLLFTVAVTVLTATLAGIVPALRSSRVQLAPALKGTGGGVVAEQPTLRKSLVVAQVTLSFLMLCAAGLFVRSLQNLMAVDPGFATTRVLTFSVNPALAGYDAQRARAYSETLLDTVRRSPGVASAAYAFMPLLGGGGWGMGFTVDGFTPPSPDEPALAMVNAVSPGYFSAMGVSLLAGRDFDARDEPVAQPGDGWPYRAAIVNQTFVDRYFKGVLPLGRSIGIGTEPGTPMLLTIVGVVRDTRYTAIREDPRAQVFVPYRQARMDNITVYARTDGDPAATMNTIRKQLAAIDPLVPIYDVSTLDDRVAESVVNERLIAALSTALSSIATLLAVVGLYGVMAYTVTRRTREIGIRMALGAMGRQVAAGVLREASTLIVFGLALGAAAAWWLGRYAEAQLYGVAAADPATFAVAAMLLSTVAVLAAVFPARRASRVSPMTALRDE